MTRIPREGILESEATMLNDKQRLDLTHRLRRINGQISGILRMIEEDRYCVDILTQTAAIASALRKVEDIVMQNHLNTCVADAIRSNDATEQRDKIAEVMTVVGKLRKRG